MGAPNQLDHIPTGTSEFGFQLLNDLAVAAYRAIQALQVTVDNEDEVVESLATRHADSAK